MERELTEDKKSRIPIGRLRQAVEQVKKERREKKERERQQNLPRRSSLPKLKESRIPTKRHTSLKLDPKTEDEFDKIYEEIVDNTVKDIDEKILEVKIEDTEVLESKFEEIIHAYDEDVNEKPTITKISKIPALRRRGDDGTSKIGALVDRVKAKNATADSELKDGGFRVTASNITIKRFSRGSSRDMSRESEVTVVKEIDSEVIDKASKTAPVKPARKGRKNSEKDIMKVDAEDKAKNGKESQVTVEERVNTSVPVKPERAKRAISREVKKDDKGTVVIEKFEDDNTKTEIITTKNEGDGTTIKTTTIEREVHSSIPIRTERLIRTYSHGINKEKPVTEKFSRHFSSKTEEHKTNNENTDEKTASAINKTETTVKEHVTGIPVKTERFTRGISIEMGNIRARDDSDSLKDFRENGSHNIVRMISKGSSSVIKDTNSEVITTEERKEQIGNTVKETFVKETIIEETSLKTDDSVSKEIKDENELKKETLTTEYLVKEGIKVGIPVFTKTENNTESVTENIETSINEVKTFTRSASENITKTELKDSTWQRAPSFTKDTNVNNTETVTNKYTSSVSVQEGAKSFHKSDVTENISSSVSIKKVTEYQTKEQKMNVEMNTYMLRNPFDFSLKRDSYNFTNENKKKVDTKDLKKETIEAKLTDAVKEQKLKHSKDLNETNQSIITENVIEKTEIKESQETNKTEESTVTDIVIEKKEIEHSAVKTEDKDSDTEVTILKGNVSRLKNKISSLGNSKTMKQEDIDLPKSTSVSSKIAVFERLESRESITKDEKLSALNTPEIEVNIPKVEDKPKIVEELLKYETYDERDKIKIGFNYDEVIYTSEAKIVDEFWKSADGPVNNISTHNPVITNRAVLSQTNDESAPNTPDVSSVNSITNIPVVVNILNENQTVTATRESKENRESNNKFQAKTLPIIVNVETKSNVKTEATENIINVDTSTINVSAEGKDNKTNIKVDYYELPKILPDRDYETEVGKTKPGKINLNNWKTQVAVNKTLVDKKGVIKNENLDEIAKALPDIGFKNQVQVSKELPETVDLNEKKPEVARTLPAIINFNINEARNVPTIVPNNLYHKTKEDKSVTPTEDVKVTSVEEKDSLTDIEVKEESISIVKDEIKQPEIEIPEPIVIETEVIPAKEQELPEKASYKSQYMDTNNKNAKPVPGKINLNLWKNQVETNKTLLSKKSVINKELEFSKLVNKQVVINRPRKVSKTTVDNVADSSKPLPSKVSVTSTELETVRAIPTQVDSTLDSKVQTARTLPGFINFKANEDQIEAVRTLPAFLDMTTDGNQNEEVIKEDGVNITVGEARMFPAAKELQASNFQVEEVRILPAYIDIKESVGTHDITTVSDVNIVNVSTSELNFESNQSGELKTLPGKLDLRAWETQVEVNKTLLSTISKEDAKVEIIKQVDTDSSDSGNEEYDLKVDDDFVPANNEFAILKRHISNVNLRIVDENAAVDNENDLNNNSVSIVNDEPKESLSDPELVMDEPEVRETKASIMNRIRNKLYFINYRNILRNTESKRLAAEENKASFEKTEHTTQNSYSFDSNKEIHTENTDYKETNEFMEETYQKIVKEYTSKRIISESSTNINKTENYSSVNNYSKSEFNVLKSNDFVLQSSLEEFGSKEELKRAKSVAELDLGDAVNGNVQRILGRIKSVDFDSRRNVKTEKINVKEMPKKLSVLEKIRLFEALSQQTTFKKHIFLPQAICPSRTPLRVKETENITILQGKTVSKTAETVEKVSAKEKMVISEEVYEEKIESLKAAKEKYGSIDKMPVLAISETQSMPIIAFGTALVDPRLLPHLVKAAIDLGYRAFDTAYIYGNEKEIGAAINEKIQDGTVKREDLFIMSKLWSTFHRTDLVQGACRASLQNLGLDYFDLYMIHNPMSFKEGPDPIPKIASVVQYSSHDYLDAWYGMQQLVTLGLARSVGVSNFNASQLQRILNKGSVRPAVNQVECHPYLTQERLHTFCAEKNIAISCFGVLGSKGTPAEYKNSTTAAIDDPLVKVMASGLNVTPAQLLIRYQIEYGHNVVVKASSAEHLWDNLQALKFSLDSAQMTALHALNKNKRTFTFQGMGDTHKNYPFQ